MPDVASKRSSWDLEAPTADPPPPLKPLCCRRRERWWYFLTLAWSEVGCPKALAALADVSPGDDVRLKAPES